MVYAIWLGFGVKTLLLSARLLRTLLIVFWCMAQPIFSSSRPHKLAVHAVCKCESYSLDASKYCDCEPPAVITEGCRRLPKADVHDVVRRRKAPEGW